MDKVTISRQALCAQVEAALAKANLPAIAVQEVRTAKASVQQIAQDCIKSVLGIEKDSFTQRWKLLLNRSGALRTAVENAAQEMAPELISTMALETIKLTDAQIRQIRTHYRAALKDACWTAVEKVAEERALEIACEVLDGVLMD